MISYKKAHDLLLTYVSLMEEEKGARGRQLLDVRDKIKKAREEYQTYIKGESNDNNGNG